MKSRDTSLLLSAIVKMIMGFVIIGLLLFIPAGTIHYYHAWYLMALLFIPMIIVGVVLWMQSPELLQKRLQSKEERSPQQGVVKLSGLIFVIGFVLSGLDFRLGWSQVPLWLTHTAALLFLLGYAMYAEVMRENVWLSRNIQVVQEQQVVTTGLYGVVRHPMYTATLFMFLSIPLILGSWWALAILALYIPIIVIRILDEEKLLVAQLKGYDDYCRNLRWRLIPGIW